MSARVSECLDPETHTAVHLPDAHVDAADLADLASLRELPEGAAADVDVLRTRLGAPVLIVRMVVGAGVDQLHHHGTPRSAELVVSEPVVLERVLALEVARDLD